MRSPVTDLFDYFGGQHSPIYAAYLAWDADNPHFYPLFVRFAKQLADRGHRNLSSKLLFERIRWESLVRFKAGEGEDWKLNNNYTPIYARRFMAEHPRYGDLFRLRELRAMSEKEISAEGRP